MKLLNLVKSVTASVKQTSFLPTLKAEKVECGYEVVAIAKKELRETNAAVDVTIGKERVSTLALAIIAVSSSLTTSKGRKDFSNCGISTSQDILKNVYIPKTKVGMLRFVVTNFIDALDIFTIKSLDETNSQDVKDIMTNTLKLTSQITGYSLNDILNLRYKTNSQDKDSFSSFKNVDADLVTGYSINKVDTNTKEYKEAIIPSLYSRMSIALANHVKGDSPTQFNLHITDVKKLIKSIEHEQKRVNLRIADDLKTSTAFTNTNEDLIDKDGNTSITR